MVLRYSKCSLTDAEPRKGREFLAECGEQKITKNQLQAIPHCGYIHRRLWGTGQDCQDISKQSELIHVYIIYTYIIYIYANSVGQLCPGSMWPKCNTCIQQIANFWRPGFGFDFQSPGNCSKLGESHVGRQVDGETKTRRHVKA